MGLDSLARAVRMGHRVHVRLLATEQSLLAERRQHRLLRLLGRQAREPFPRLGCHPPVLADHRHLVQTVRATELEVIRVVAGGDLQGAGGELGVHVVVGDHRQAAAHQRQDAVLADQLPVALIGRVHRNGRVGQHRLRPHRGHRQHGVRALDRIVDRVKRVLDLAILDLKLGDHRARADVPVDHVVVAVDVALLVEADEDAVDGAHVVLVEGEALALVVAGGAKPLQLLDDL